MGDFDKEAERRKLREKYERDEERREETQRMSELLLQGATMTNKHCDSCGAPIFRYEGQEFCPNCQGGGAAQEVSEAADEAAADVAAGEATVAADGEDADASATDPDATAADADGASQRPAGTPHPDAATPSAARDGSAERPTASSADGDVRRPPAADVGQSEPPETTERGVQSGARSADLTAARASLVRALTEHAGKAESTSDPRRAREHLSAAREAAEAIAALDR
jgi:uncharacterized Zn finger protein (UPF0148 family)